MACFYQRHGFLSHADFLQGGFPAEITAGVIARGQEAGDFARPRDFCTTRHRSLGNLDCQVEGDI